MADQLIEEREKLEETDEVEELPEVVLPEKMVDWDGEEVTEDSWHTKTLVEIGEVEVTAGNLSVSVLAAILVSALCCCYCSWRNRRKIA